MLCELFYSFCYLGKYFLILKFIKFIWSWIYNNFYIYFDVNTIYPILFQIGFHTMRFVSTMTIFFHFKVVPFILWVTKGIQSFAKEYFLNFRCEERKVETDSEEEDCDSISENETETENEDKDEDKNNDQKKEDQDEEYEIVSENKRKDQKKRNDQKKRKKRTRTLGEFTLQFILQDSTVASMNLLYEIVDTQLILLKAATHTTPFLTFDVSILEHSMKNAASFKMYLTLQNQLIQNNLPPVFDFFILTCCNHSFIYRQWKSVDTFYDHLILSTTPPQKNNSAAVHPVHMQIVFECNETTFSKEFDLKNTSSTTEKYNFLQKHNCFDRAFFLYFFQTYYPSFFAELKVIWKKLEMVGSFQTTAYTITIMDDCMNIQTFTEKEMFVLERVDANSDSPMFLKCEESLII